MLSRLVGVGTFVVCINKMDAVGFSDTRFAEVREHVVTTIDELARLLDGRRYLVGDTFSAADLTLASLATPVLMPDGFGVPSLSRRDLPDDLGAIVDGLRKTPVGEHVLRMYREHRAPR